MQKRKLGKSNLEVSAIGFGCMGMTGVCNSPGDRRRSHAKAGIWKVQPEILAGTHFRILGTASHAIRNEARPETHRQCKHAIA
jgi:hypothetical protein